MKKFFKKIFGLDMEMTDQEKLIYDIFVKLLDHQETNKVLYNSSCSYLSNAGMGIEAAINGNEVILKSGNEVMSIMCNSKFMLHLSKVVDNSVERNVDNLYMEMMEGQKSALRRIDNRIDPDTSTIRIEA